MSVYLTVIPTRQLESNEIANINNRYHLLNIFHALDLFSKYLMSVSYVPAAALGTGDALMNKTEVDFNCKEFTFW